MLAILGSVMNNRFYSEFMGNLSPTVKTFVPSEQLASMANNPQALVSVEAQNQLKSMFEAFGEQGMALFDQLLFTLREALNSAISHVFLVGLGIIIFAFLVNFFMKERRLSRQMRRSEVTGFFLPYKIPVSNLRDTVALEILTNCETSPVVKKSLGTIIVLSTFIFIVLLLKLSNR